jgi:TonB family protein
MKHRGVGSLKGALGFVLAVTFTAGVFASPVPVRAQVSDTWNNPFCAGLAAAMPWNAKSNSPGVTRSSDRYVVQVLADGKTDVAATVTLITTDDAYSVDVTRRPLLRESGSDVFYAEPILVSFDKPVDVRYVYVDSVGVDGAKPAACPSVVRTVEPFTVDPNHPYDLPSIGSDVVPIAATYVQALPALACGHVYSGPEIQSQGPLVGFYGNDVHTAVVHVYIDSNGTPARTSIERSSGIAGLDAAAIGGVQQGKFKPAEFLCTPVVSEMSIDMRYRP